MYGFGSGTWWKTEVFFCGMHRWKSLRIAYESADGPLNRRQGVLLLVHGWVSQIPAGSYHVWPDLYTSDDHSDGRFVLRCDSQRKLGLRRTWQQQLFLILGKKAGGAASIVAHRRSLVLASRTRFHLDHYGQTGNSSADLYSWCSLGFTLELCHHLSWAQLGMSIFCYWAHWCQSLFDTVSLLFLRLYCVWKALFFVSVYMSAVKKSCKLIWHPPLDAVRIIHSFHANFRPFNNVMQRKRNENMTCTWHLMQNVLNWCDLQKCFFCQQSTLTCVMKNVRPWACF